MRFRSKPVEIEAMQWFEHGDHALVMRDNVQPGNARVGRVKGAQGWAHVDPGDWIIQEPLGPGYYPCKPDVFAAKYEPVDEPTETA